MIYILSGDIRTGKTTALQEWIKGWQNVKGVLTPDNEEGIRELYHIAEGRTHPFQVTREAENTVSVGRFLFLKESFLLANEILIQEFEEDNFEFLVIDELGKLELKGQGLHRAAQHILSSKKQVNGHILIVVRSFLVEQVIEKYGITDYVVVSKSELP